MRQASRISGLDPLEFDRSKMAITALEKEKREPGKELLWKLLYLEKIYSVESTTLPLYLTQE